MSDEFSDAVRALSTGSVGAGLAEPFTVLFPITGVSVATLGSVLGSETLAASDAVALRLDELQFDLGEGPCWDALRSGAPCLVDDIPAEGTERWPTFGPAVSDIGVGAMFVFPLRVGPLPLGAIDLYSDHRQTLAPRHVSQASVLATVVSRVILREAATRLDDDVPMSGHSRRLVHQATGRVIVQANVGPDDARLLIEGLAFSAGRRVLEVADDIMEGRLSFHSTDQGIEDHLND